MKIINVLIVCLLLFGFTLNSAFAAPSKSHSHNGRVHSHILPKTGVRHYHKHVHNGRAHIHPYSAKVGFKHSHNKSARAKAWLNAVKHEHNGRPHSHPLPRSGIKHDHRHKHGGRSHIHPLPISGTKHFHKLNQKPTSRVVQSSATPRRITGLSIKQQIAAVLKIPLPNKPKAITAQGKASAAPRRITGLNIKQQMAEVLRTPLPNKQKVITSQRKMVTPAKVKQQHNTSPLNPRTINKVLGQYHRHKNRSHQHALPAIGTKHRHKTVVITQKRRPIKKAVVVKRAPVKTRPARKASPKKINNSKKARVVKKTITQPIKPIPVPRRTKQTPQQITEGNRQFTLALRYENGTGVKKNLPQAFNWYQRASRNGNSKAQFKLARMFETGTGTKQNIPQSISWYTKSASNGNANAQVNLGNKYAEGTHVARNTTEAIRWYKMAANQGDLRGRANLNYLIEE